MARMTDLSQDMDKDWAATETLITVGDRSQSNLVELDGDGRKKDDERKCRLKMYRNVMSSDASFHIACFMNNRPAAICLYLFTKNEICFTF